MKINIKHLLLSIAFSAFFCTVTGQKQTHIAPGESWPDTDGNHIQAHGGGIVKFGKTYYWYGEQRRKEAEADTVYRYVSCYSSTDLMNWKFLGDAIKLSKPDTIKSRLVLERPKVFYNAKTKKYVMYMHLDGNTQDSRLKYEFASVGVAVSSRPEGPFTFVKSFRPLGKESRDIGQFIDDDGSAYLIFESRPTMGFYIVKLSDDYLSVEKEIAFIQSPLEGGALVHYRGLYYIVASALTGWNPNPNKVASAPSLSGPWSEFTDIAPPETKTYNSQSTYLLKVTGTKDTTIIFMADRWNPRAQWNSRYLWMPVEIGNGKLWITEPRPWTINVKTGVHSFIISGEKSK